MSKEDSLTGVIYSLKKALKGKGISEMTLQSVLQTNLLSNACYLTREITKMARVKRGVIAGARHKKILKLAKGYKGARSRVFRVAKQAVIKAGQYAYRDRRQKKRQFRSLWIAKINAAARLNNLSYSKFMHYLHKSELEIDRKVLADIAANSPERFSSIVKTVVPN